MIAAAEPDEPLLARCGPGRLDRLSPQQTLRVGSSDVDLTSGKMHVSRASTPVNGRHIETETKTHQARSIALEAVAVEVLGRRWDLQRWHADSVEVAPDRRSALFQGWSWQRLHILYGPTAAAIV